VYGYVSLIALLNESLRLDVCYPITSFEMPNVCMVVFESIAESEMPLDEYRFGKCIAHNI